MKVFISWSGNQSRDVAQVLKEWLPVVIQAVRPYFSPADIEKGARWSSDIAKELEESSVGIICLTKSNLSAPWIMFEAGALAKSMEKSRVIPLLLGVDPSELSGPLTQFQAAGFNKEDVHKLLRAINSALQEGKLEQDVLNMVFEKWWPELEARVLDIFEHPESNLLNKNPRSDRDLLEEILGLVRSRRYEEDMLNPIMLRPIEDLNLSEQSIKILQDGNIYYIGDLAPKQPIDLLKMQNIGKRTLNEVTAALSEKGIILGAPVAGWPPRFDLK